MNAQHALNSIEKIEVNGSIAIDARAAMRDERFAILAAIRKKQGVGEAVAEANRVAKMWGLTLA